VVGARDRPAAPAALLRVLTLVAPVVVLTLVAVVALAQAPRAAESPVAAAARCDCTRFADELAATRALYASRGEGATRPPSDAARTRFRERLLATHGQAGCLVACTSVPDAQRDDARVLLAAAAFKSRRLGPSDAAANERLIHALDETEHCRAHQPAPPLCHLWHGSIRGILARGSWNPLQLALPKQLFAEFRAARAGAAPGRDQPDGAATRAQASLLLQAPQIAGGDPHAARRLMEKATMSPLYPCTVSNRILFAETCARTGAAARAASELHATLDAGLPECGDNRYENAVDLDEAARCLARLEAKPDQDPGWDDDCR
jgi:hypothetical protein